MINTEAELLHLQIKLQALSGKEEILNLFLKELKRIFPSYKFKITQEHADDTDQEIAIESRETVFGYLQISCLTLAEKDTSLLAGSCQLTGSLLEKEKLKRQKHPHNENYKQYELLEHIFTNEPITSEVNIRTRPGTENRISQNVGRPLLRKVIGGYLSLLDTSAAVIDNHGDCSLHYLNSSWCRLLQTTSRKNCHTSSEAEAIASGKWLCYESCMVKGYDNVLKEGSPAKTRCNGALKILTYPVKTNNEVVGGISLAYGTPPRAEEELASVASDYNINIEKLREAAKAYIPRPKFIVEYAKNQLGVAANILGELYEKKLTVNTLEETKERWKNLFNKSPYAIAIYEAIEDGNDFLFKDLNPAGLKIDKVKAEKVIGKPISEVFPGADEHGFLDVFRKVWKTGKEQNNDITFYKDERIQGWRENIIYKLNTGEIVAVYNDATGRKQAEEALIKKEKKLKEQNEEYLSINEELRESNERIFEINEELTRMITIVRQGEEKFRKAFVTNPDAININRLNDGMYVEINHGFTNIMGYTEEEVLGKTSVDLNIWHHPEDRQKLVSGLRKTGKVENLEALFVTKNGEIIVGLMSASIIYLKGESHILSITRDITERKQSHEKLEGLYNQLNLITENIPEAIAHIDNSLKYLYINENYAELLGYSKDEAVNKKIEDLLPSVIWEESKPYIASVLKGETVSFEMTSITIAGNPAVFSINFIPQKNKSGKVVAFFTFGQDITSRKENEERLQIQSTALESAANGIVITTNTGRIIMINAAFTELTGYTFDEIKGKSPNILKSGYHKSDFYDHLWNTILSGEVWKGEIINKRKDGSIYTENMVITPVLSKENELTHFIAIKEDITGRKIAQEKLKIAKEKAEESDRLKSAFLANISHEIRTPMNGIVGFSEMLIKPNLSEEKRGKFINIIKKSCRQLTLIIDDIVDVSRIETNQIKLNQNETHVESIMKNLLNFFRPQAREKNINLEFADMENRQVNAIYTDEVKLTQVLTNLIGNAIKFTNNGSVIFGCTLKGEMLQFYVKDTGIGIKPGYQRIIFERFRQVETSMSRNYGGTGLGLSISKAFVEMMGGKISLDSIPGEGSTFLFSIPFEPVSKPSKSSSSEAKNSIFSDFNKHTVLIAEDEAMNYLYLEEVLKETRIKLLHAANGREAIDICKKHQQIDLILMDIKMPLLNGIEATREIKSFRPEIPVIAVTAYALDGDKEKILEAGCTDYLSKPVKKADLIEKLKQYLR
ncbi:MAG TPA: PAS domain S-box protein [Bacteroidales bacterium]|nr:PAS domain S-box protein [Bacteroidales bacterium]